MKNIVDEAFIKKLKAALPEKRFKHCKGVRDTAVMLAEKFGADAEKAYIAGIFHDCAKGMKISEQLEKCREYKLELDDITLSCPPVIHAPLGAETARREYGICDEEILNAIRRHTVGGHGMTLLDKIIYTADMIEPGRDFDGVDKLRRAAQNDINEVFFLCVRQSLLFNIKANKPIHPDTLVSYNECIL